MRVVIGSIFTAILLIPGCAAQSPTYEKKLADLREKLLIMQNDRDRFAERLTALERRHDELVTAQGKSVVPRQERRPLKVLRLSPDAQNEPKSESEAPSQRRAKKTDERTLISGSGTNVTTSVSSEEIN